jgi:hypothetical protein
VLSLYFVSPLYIERFSSASTPSLSIVLLISSFLGVILHLKGLGRMLSPSLLKVSTLKSIVLRNLRIIEDIDGNFFSICVHGFADVESP